MAKSRTRKVKHTRKMRGKTAKGGSKRGVGTLGALALAGLAGLSAATNSNALKPGQGPNARGSALMPSYGSSGYNVSAYMPPSTTNYSKYGLNMSAQAAPTYSWGLTNKLSSATGYLGKALGNKVQNAYNGYQRWRMTPEEREANKQKRLENSAMEEMDWERQAEYNQKVDQGDILGLNTEAGYRSNILSSLIGDKLSGQEKTNYIHKVLRSVKGWNKQMNKVRNELGIPKSSVIQL